MMKQRPFRRKLERGFTLVEMVVVITNLALLAAIIVPLVGRQIDDAKISRAKNECLVIAAAIQSFYKDMGAFPAAGTVVTAKYNVLRSLVSGTAIDSDVPGTASAYGFTADGNDNWYDGGSGASTCDVFDNHLNINNPKGNSNFYRTTGEFRWRGPYMPPIGMDPWGHAYMCNIQAVYSGTDTMCVIMSAGPNGSIDTTFTGANYGVPSTTTGPTGDDIWAVVHIRS